MHRVRVAAILSLCAWVALVASASRASGVPSWLKLRIGTEALTATDGGNSGTVTLCRTAGAFIRYVHVEAGAECACTKYTLGIRVHITARHAQQRIGNLHLPPLVQVAKKNGRVLGWGQADGSIVPVVPRGAALITMPKGVSATVLFRSSSENQGPGIDLPANTPVSVIDQLGADANGPNLKVRVNSGRYAGKVGWVLPSAVVANGNPLIINY